MKKKPPDDSFRGIPCRRSDRLKTCKRRSALRTHYWTELRRRGRPLATIATALVEPLRDHLEKLNTP